MPRLQIPTSFNLLPTSSSPQSTSASCTLTNKQEHRLSIHPISQSIIRVVHALPREKFQQRNNGGIEWEENVEGVIVEVQEEEEVVQVSTATLRVKVFVGEGCPRLEWFDLVESEPLEVGEAFMKDSKTRAYTFDAASGSVMHYVERENYLPLSEDEQSLPGSGEGSFVHPERNEFVYGLGESRGTIEKSGKKFTMEGRDALSYDWSDGDPLYKVNPFYTVFNKKTGKWYGIFYNNLSDGSFDMGAENDILWGCFKSCRFNCGPLDYYVIRGDGTLPSILTSYASLLSPTSPSFPAHPISASPSLPPLSQFGYLASSLSMAADANAQEAIIEFLRTSRKEGFAVDGLYLSSGWCQDEITDDRNYFVWNKSRYPTPFFFGHTIETELKVQVIVNMKPWLLSNHPFFSDALTSDTFIKSAPDIVAMGKGDDASSWVWGAGFGSHKLGKYFDYSGKKGSEWWGRKIKETIMDMGLTGMWIDNNEMAGMVDDDELFRGEVGMWAANGGTVATNVEQRLGWGLGEIRVGSAGKATNTMGMARATYEAVIRERPTHRPVIVSRSGVPGIQAYAHASWSGDNSTTWKALKWGTKMTLSLGMSFGPGLYGHDIGGFAGKMHPSPELLIRWCQNGAWHSRFTVHSWKEQSTTLWMYKSQPGVTEILRNVLCYRYRLAPMFYSLYVTHYHRRGWPILKPLLWHHSNDPLTLHIDEDFLFGSHVLVASVTEKGATKRSVYLPALSLDEDDLQWCELDTGIWHAGAGKNIELDAPLQRTPVLVRGGGIIVLGGECTETIYDGRSTRGVLIFPSPTSRSGSSGMEGSFTLIEDDGKSSDHTSKGIYSEIQIFFRVVQSLAEMGGEAIEVGYDVVTWKYTPEAEVLWFTLPKGDIRRMQPSEGRSGIWEGDAGEGRFGLKLEP